jgi:glycosyltransferase involved in cell wall biosynthesis/SAM-dependent methyltransferase
MAGTRIGILTINDVRRGLWRDTECLLWALQQDPLRRFGRRPATISVFPISDYSLLEREPGTAQAAGTKTVCKAAVPKGTHFLDWLRNIDTLIICEKLLSHTFAQAKQHGVQVVYIPNMDWAAVHGQVGHWVKAVQSSGCQVWAKTSRGAEALKNVGIDCHLVPWSIPDPVNRSRQNNPACDMNFLVNAGMGGWHNRRGVDIAIQAFAMARRQLDHICLRVKSIKPLAHYVPENLLKTPGLEVIEGLVSREDIFSLYESADAVLYPSRWDGFGLSLLEALHAGLPIIATDGWPMNELVEHEHNGLLVKSQQVGIVRLAPHWECDSEALAAAILRFASDAELRRRLNCPEPAELVSRQYQFILRVRELLLHEQRPRVVIFRSRSEPRWRRSEEYWIDALERHGYSVDRLFFDSDLGEIKRSLDESHDFVLVSKASEEFLNSINTLTEQPIALWHHDRSDLQKTWMQSIQGSVDLLCVPESSLNQRITGLQAPTITLLPGAKVDGDRGPGKRPIHLAEPDTGPEIVFLGNYEKRGNRIHVLNALSQHFNVQIYGKGWPTSPLRTHLPIWSREAANLNRQAKIVLSVSNSATVPHYTSNRLFHSCGVGACVAAEAYPGMDEHFPKESVARFSTTADCISTIRQLLADDSARARMRTSAEDHTWRYHTWSDRIYQLLHVVKNLAVSRERRSPMINIWDQRASRLQHRSVGYHSWNETRFEEETKRWWERLYAHFLSLSAEEVHSILDFGCGVGRFSTRLASCGLEVTGADISLRMLQLANKSTVSGLKLLQISPNAPLPFASGAFDALWICTVLQHIHDSMFTEITKELRRVLKQDALLLICENTEQRKGRWSKSGHVIFRRPNEYIAHFTGISIVDEFSVEGERHTVFAGRLQSSRQ